jgi:GT2 family glycosyltransferase
MKASIIIPTHQRPAYLLDAIESVRKQYFPADAYEILVVDNAANPSSETASLCNSCTAPLTRYIHEPRNGLHNARHTGARAANGEILVYIDDDAVCDANFLTEILKPFSDKQVGCVGGRILPQFEVPPPEWLGMFPKWYLSILDDSEGPKEVQYIYGCSFSIRRALLFELGGFNPDGFGDKKLWWHRGDGEIGLLRKAQVAGLKTIYTPDAVVQHFIPKERLSLEYFRERAFKSGIEASFSKHHYDNKPLNPLILLLRSGAFAIYYFSQKIIIYLHYKNNTKRKVMAAFYKARCLYELNLIINRKLQRSVKKQCNLEGASES